MRNLSFFAILLVLASPGVFADSGIISVKSVHSVEKTLDRLEALLHKKGMTIFKRVNHSVGAKGVGIDLRPTEVLIFGNPKIGSPMMVCAQTIAIDLPQKALAWEDEKGQVWLSYNDPSYLATRHHMKGCDKIVKKVSTALANFAKGATKP